MRTHTDKFKQEIKKLGRQIDGKIYYYPNYNLISEDNETILTENDIELVSEQFNKNNPIEIDSNLIYSMNIIKNGNLLQSLMKQFDFEAKYDLNIGSVINPNFGLLVNNNYEYLNYGDYIIYSKEYNLDSETWNYVCYDMMLYSMIKYIPLPDSSYPITVRDYINIISDKIGIEFANKNDTFVNYNELINQELFLGQNFTYRDILDKLSQITASNIIINDNNELEIKYINQTIGKNLFNKDISDIQLGSITASGVPTTSSTNFRTATFIEVQPNTKYTISLNTSVETLRFNEYNSSQGFIQRTLVNNNKVLTITTTANTKYLTWSLNYNDSTRFTIDTAKEMLDTLDLQVEQGNQATSYEPFGDTIDEKYLKDINVAFGEKFGEINRISIADSENNLEFYSEDSTSIADNGKTQINIIDNEIAFNGNTQAMCEAIFNKLNGICYSLNDFATTGVCYYDYLDLFNVKVKEKIYKCLLLNNEININQGISENIFTEEIEDTEFDSNNYDTSVLSNKTVTFKINQQEKKLEQAVMEDNIVASLNLAIEDGQGVVELKGNTVIIDSDKFKLDTNGNMVASNGTFNGGRFNLTSDEANPKFIIKSSYESGLKGEFSDNGILYINKQNNLYNSLMQFLNVGASRGDINIPMFNMQVTKQVTENTWIAKYVGQITPYSAAFVERDDNGVEVSKTVILTESVTTPVVIQTSKKEDKKNFEKYSDALEQIKNTDIYKYNLKIEDDDKKKHIGFVIGKEYNYSHDITAIDEENNEIGVDLYSMVSVLWQAVKEQQEIIENLQKELKK